MFTHYKATELKSILKIHQLKSNGTLKNSKRKIPIEKPKISKSAITHSLLMIKQLYVQF